MQLDLFLGSNNELSTVALLDAPRPRQRPLDRPAPRISIPEVLPSRRDEIDCEEDPERWDGLS